MKRTKLITVVKLVALALLASPSTAQVQTDGAAFSQANDVAQANPDFAYDGGGRGKAGTVTMTANGNKIAEGRLERTVPVQFSLGEGLDIGVDSGSAVDFTYELPFKFTGTIEKVEIDLAPKN